MVHVGCWAHARRKFVDAVKVNPQDAEAVKMVVRMDALFLVDRDARQQEMSAEDRLKQRRGLAAPRMAEIRKEWERLKGATLPKRALAKR
jgi:transposase